MQEIQFIAPVALHDEMLRLRNEKRIGLPRESHRHGLGSSR